MDRIWQCPELHSVANKYPWITRWYDININILAIHQPVSPYGLSNDNKWQQRIRFTGCQYRRARGSSLLSWSKGQQPPDDVLYSSGELSELSQWFCNDANTINIVVVIIIIIILNTLLILLLSSSKLSIFIFSSNNSFSHKSTQMWFDSLRSYSK